MKRVLFLLVTILLAFSFYGCKKTLTPEVYSQLSEENYLSTEEGIESVLNQAYSQMQRHGHELTAILHTDLFVTGRGISKVGAWANGLGDYFRLWTWSSTQWNIASNWDFNYRQIYNCNVVLDNIENNNFSDEFKSRLKGQALALRAYAYYDLFDYFGSVVIKTDSKESEFDQPRATLDEIKNRIETDFLDAIELLPVNQPEYDRITKGGAMGMLCKFYLNTKQWEKCEKMARDIMELHKYELYPDYIDLFHMDAKGKNKEAMWILPGADLPGMMNTLGGLTYPPDYPFPGTQAAWPSRVYIPDWVIDSYLPDDKRAGIFVKQYVNTSGKTVVGYGKNQSLCFKYGLDPNADGGNAGYDFIKLRYADILLARAEALNEMDGPNQESIDLLNKIRDRADIPEAKLSSMGSKEDLRDTIAQEREWEFFFEDKTRQDLLRYGKFVSDAQSRGVANAADYRKLYPIPQSEIDNNSEIEQNSGY